MEDSNKTLALLLVAAIVVSLGGTIVSLNKLGQMSSITGRVTTQGTATVTVTQTAIVNVSDAAIAFGSGSLTGGYDNCTLNSNASAVSPSGCGDWSWTAGDNFTLENIGSATIDVTIQSNKNATEFIGGTSPTFKFLCRDMANEGGSETYPLGQGANNFTEFDKTAQSCVNSLEATAANDEMGVFVETRVGLGASGAKTSTITFAASAS